MKKIIKQLYLNGCVIKKNEPLKNYTNFNIGGNTPYLLLPNSKSSLIFSLKTLLKEKIPFKILGGGSNLIIKDNCLDYLVLCTKFINSIEYYKYDNNYCILNVESGFSLSKLSLLSAEIGLSGLEFACGIPGTLGGAIYMNAGAYDGEIQKIIDNVEIFDLNDQKIKVFSKQDMNFNYRKSILQNKNLIALSAKLKLIYNEKDKILKDIKHLLEKRWESQPLDLPSAGSTFKRPKPDFYIGTTIEKLGLKGFTIGGAQISEKHAGFIVNKNNASYNDVINLINYIKKIIYENYKINIEIEPEIWD